MSAQAGRHRSALLDAVLMGLAAVVFVSMILLGNWQMARLSWKLDLIAQVESRAFAEPVQASVAEPLPAYQRVGVIGRFDHGAALRVKALTDLGPGHWVVTPLMTDEGAIWVNRGFVPSPATGISVSEPNGLQRVTGLVRDSVPNGTLLEKNDPGTARWFSVDIPAMTKAAGLDHAASYYIDADHIGPVDAWPRGGLTRLEFRNSHLSYALTWYAMALLFFCALGFVMWQRFWGTEPD
ncbi:MAG: SURF1 family protein [Pseudomonadota bacterium]